MKYLVFIFSFLISLNIAFSQADSLDKKIFIISNNSLDTISLKDKGYFISAVNDLRPNKKNIGSFNMKEGKLSILTKDSLPVYVYNLLKPQTNSDSSLKPLVLNIEKLKTFASTNGNIASADIYIKLNAQSILNGQLQVIHTFEKTFSFQKKDRADFINYIIKATVEASLASMPVIIRNNKVEKSYIKQIKETNTPENENRYVIPNPGNNQLDLPGYYLKNIIDNRADTSNEGGVYTGYFNRVASAQVDSGLKKYIQKMIVQDSLKEKKPVTLYIYNFRCTENLTNNYEQARFSLVAWLTVDSLGTEYIIHKQKIEIDTITEADITKCWPNIIKKGFDKFFTSINPGYKPSLFDTTKTDLSKEIIIRRSVTKNYFYQGEQIKSINGFNKIFASTSDDALKRQYKSAKAHIRTGRTLIMAGAIFLSYPLADYLKSEEKSFKKYYNDEGPNINSTLLIDKKTLIPMGSAIFVTGFIVKWIGKGLLNKAVSKYNDTLFKRISFDVHPNINSSGCNFKLGILLSQK